MKSDSVCDSKSVCDCGGEKARTTHSHWCRVLRRNRDETRAVVGFSMERSVPIFKSRYTVVDNNKPSEFDKSGSIQTVSYTHLTLPTICSV